MLVRQGNLWTMPADARCITTNGMTRPSDGKAVMGGGCALDARNRYPGLDTYLGLLLHDHGNHVFVLMEEAKEPRPTGVWNLVSFPTKHHYKDDSDLDLIRRSCAELMALADTEPNWQTILLPRPGVGLGRLSWPVVQKAISPLLDDRVVVIARDNRESSTPRGSCTGRGTSPALGRGAP
jgi:hypothetical protein